jgi:ribosome-associated protein
MRKKNQHPQGHHQEPVVSKTQRKKEADDIRSLGEKLCQLTDAQLQKLPYPELLVAIQDYRKINKGNARKRQLQYIGKQLRKLDLDPVISIIERYDSASRSHLLKMKRLEAWRDGLLGNEPATLTEIAEAHPGFDRQHLRQLVKEARKEADRIETDPSSSRAAFRKLFQYLKALDDAD